MPTEFGALPFQRVDHTLRMSVAGVEADRPLVVGERAVILPTPQQGLPEMIVGMSGMIVGISGTGKFEQNQEKCRFGGR